MRHVYQAMRDTVLELPVYGLPPTNFKLDQLINFSTYPDFKTRKALINAGFVQIYGRTEPQTWFVLYLVDSE